LRKIGLDLSFDPKQVKKQNQRRRITPKRASPTRNFEGRCLANYTLKIQQRHTKSTDQHGK